MWRMLIETAVLRKSENIQPNLAGEWMRAILTGAPYPLTLLSTLIMRLRADHDVNALRVAILKSVLIKNFKMEVPVSLDPECKDPGYLLGRLFAVYEQIQTAALGRNVNATIKDKFYGAASAQPRKVFPHAGRRLRNHLSKIGKQKPGLRVNLRKTVGCDHGVDVAGRTIRSRRAFRTRARPCSRSAITTSAMNSFARSEKSTPEETAR